MGDTCELFYGDFMELYPTHVDGVGTCTCLLFEMDSLYFTTHGSLIAALSHILWRLLGV